VKWNPKTNTALPEKLALRPPPPTNASVIETHAGFGEIHSHTYAHLATGVAIDRDPKAAEHLADTRPTWRIIEGDAAHALACPCPPPTPVTHLDVDASGDPWPTLTAALLGPLPKATRLEIVVTDGLRLRLRMGNEGAITSLHPYTLQHGIRCEHKYLDVVAYLAQHLAEQAHRRLTDYHAQYAGRTRGLVLWRAVMEAA